MTNPCKFYVSILLVAFYAALWMPKAYGQNEGFGKSDGQQLTDDASVDLAKALGISFSDRPSTVVLTKGGRRYVIDTSTKTIRELSEEPHLLPASMQNRSNSGAASLFQQNCAACHGSDGKGNKGIGTPNFTDPAVVSSVSADEMRSAIEKGKNGRMPAWSGKLTEAQISDLVTYIRSLPGNANDVPKASATTQVAQTDQHNATIYHPGDDLLISLPTGKLTDKHGVYVNFTHRFTYDTTFTGPARGAQLFGLDNVAIASFGFRYGITDCLSVGVFRSSSLINRPIQLMAGYNILEEQKNDPFNLMVRVSVEGQDNFRKNFTENVEGIVSKSITSKAQVYLVPTFSFNDRLLLAPSGFFSTGIADVPGVNAFSLGTGLAVDVRPSVALLAEIIPTLLNSRALDIHRPVYSFGIQKKMWRHAFTLAFTTSPGSMVSQRAATRASFLGEPGADTLSGLTVGFNLMRQIH